MTKLDYRYELKYVLDPSAAFHLESMLLSHPAGFNKAFEDRVINNIYFDDHLFSTCNDNLSGIADRIKIRYRWYGLEDHTDNGVLEYKIKKNALGTKVHHRDIPYASLKQLSSIVNDKMTNRTQVSPVIRNQYLRSYFIDISGKYRLTVDRNVLYDWPSDNKTIKESAISDTRIIVEVKFDNNADTELDSVSRDIPFRLSKHSKYLSGMYALYG